MGRLKRVPHEGNEYYYAITTGNFKSICLGILGVLAYNITTGNVNFSHPGIYGVYTIAIFTGGLYLFFKSRKDWGYGTVSTFKYKKIIAKIIGFTLSIFVGVFCSYSYELMLLPNSAVGKAETYTYILQAATWLVVYMILIRLFVHFAINTVSEFRSK
jgi:hypothetical protein